MAKASLTKTIILIVLTAFALHPMGVYAQHPVSPERKGVRISTDVVALALPVAAVAGVVAIQDWQGLKQGAFTAATCVGATMLLKYTIHKQRPDLSDNHSFPSMHTSTTFAAATFLQRRYGWKFGVPAYALAVYTGWGRTFARKHDWWDVAAGAAIGAGSALIFTRPWAQKHELSIAPGSDGENFYVTAAFKF